jgi:uncharacterized protein (DUF736 family)
MSDYDNTNSGALFKNDRKVTPNQPDYRGDINVNGTDFWISAWLKESKKGTKFMSLAVTVKEPINTAAPVQQSDDGDLEDLPF